jgi:CRISPR-associated protein Cas2
MAGGFYLVCYDVVGDGRRVRVANLLKGYGLRVQKSVFECVLSGDQLEYVRGKLEGYLKVEEDQVRFYPMSVPTRRKVVVLGVQPEVVVDDDVFIV